MNTGMTRDDYELHQGDEFFLYDPQTDTYDRYIAECIDDEGINVYYFKDLHNKNSIKREDLFNVYRFEKQTRSSLLEKANELDLKLGSLYSLLQTYESSKYDENDTGFTVDFAIAITKIKEAVSSGVKELVRMAYDLGYENGTEGM